MVIRTGLATAWFLVATLWAWAAAPATAAEAPTPTRGFRHCGLYVHGCWLYRYPFATRTWSRDDYGAMYEVLARRFRRFLRKIDLRAPMAVGRQQPVGGKRGCQFAFLQGCRASRYPGDEAAAQYGGRRVARDLARKRHSHLDRREQVHRHRPAEQHPRATDVLGHTAIPVVGARVPVAHRHFQWEPLQPRRSVHPTALAHKMTHVSSSRVRVRPGILL